MNPTIKGNQMHCYHPNRGWSIDLLPNIIVGYVELMPAQNKTAVFVRCILNGKNLSTAYVDGLNPQVGADKLDDLIWQASYGRLELSKGE